jgi:4-hydroxythreonine-4-phosphate dehydrogenase
MILALTPGEPAGIGPDLCVQLAQQALPVAVVAVADPQMLQRRAARLGLPLQLSQDEAALEPAPPGGLYVLPVPLRKREACGRLDPANAAYVLDSLRVAAEADQTTV